MIVNELTCLPTTTPNTHNTKTNQPQQICLANKCRLMNARGILRWHMYCVIGKNMCSGWINENLCQRKVVQLCWIFILYYASILLQVWNIAIYCVGSSIYSKILKYSHWISTKVLTSRLNIKNGINRSFLVPESWFTDLRVFHNIISGISVPEILLFSYPL